MKKLLTFAIALGLVAYLSSASAYAQGKGQGRGPSVNSGPGRSADHANSDHANTSGREDHRENHDAEHRAEHKEHEKARFQERINNNPELKAKLEHLLPAGTTLATASNGFKNQGQFIAALHVSQ